MAKTEIKSFDVWTMGKLFALVGAIWGAIIGLIGGIIATLNLSILLLFFPGAEGIAATGFFTIWITSIIVNLIGGLIGGIILAIIYNFVAERIGGLQFKN